MFYQTLIFKDINRYSLKIITKMLLAITFLKFTSSDLWRKKYIEITYNYYYGQFFLQYDILYPRTPGNIPDCSPDAHMVLVCSGAICSRWYPEECPIYLKYISLNISICVTLFNML